MINDIIKVLNQAIVAVENNDVKSLFDSSNRLVHTNTTLQLKESIRLSVNLYALAKILNNSKNEEKNDKDWQIFWKKIKTLLNALRVTIKEKGVEKFNIKLKKLYDEIKKFDKKFEEHVSTIFERARVNKAFKIFEHGVSTGRVAEILGISQWEANKYIGLSKTFERDISKNVILRYNKVKKILES